MKINLKSNFLKSLSVLTGGSLIANVILAIQQIALARIFTPGTLGIYSYLMSVPMGVVGIVCGRYDLTIVYESDEDKILPLIKLNLIINIIISSTVTVAYFLFILLFKNEYSEYIYLMPFLFIYLIGYGLTNTLNAYNNRYREYSVITKMYVYRTVAQCFGTVVLGFILVKIMNHDYLSIPILVIPYCLGMFFGVYSQGKKLWESRREIYSIPMKRVIEIAREHKKQPLLSAPAIFSNGFSYSLVTMFTEGLYGEEANGYYSISTRLLGMPISLISGNISKIYMERASVEYNLTGEYKTALTKTFKFLFILSIPLFFAMYFLAPPICSFLFGGEWIIAGDYIRILALMFTLRFIATAISPGLYVCRKQQTELVIQFMLLLVTFCSGFVSFLLTLPVEYFLWIVCLSRSLVLLLHIIAVFYYSGFRLINKGRKNND